MPGRNSPSVDEIVCSLAGEIRAERVARGRRVGLVRVEPGRASRGPAGRGARGRLRFFGMTSTNWIGRPSPGATPSRPSRTRLPRAAPAAARRRPSARRLRRARRRLRQAEPHAEIAKHFVVGPRFADRVDGRLHQVQVIRAVALGDVVVLEKRRRRQDDIGVSAVSVMTCSWTTVNRSSRVRPARTRF